PRAPGYPGGGSRRAPTVTGRPTSGGDSVDTMHGRTALVTGGSRGIGLAIARSLVDRGARVVVTARKPEALAEAVESLGGRAVVGEHRRLRREQGRRHQPDHPAGGRARPDRPGERRGTGGGEDPVRRRSLRGPRGGGRRRLPRRATRRAGGRRGGCGLPARRR